MQPKIYIYKMSTDNGGAPCIWKGLLSLAICKPVIRRVAKQGSIIFGFGSKEKKYEERLLYIAEVTFKPATGEYYKDKKYRNRPDCIYERTPDGTARLKRSARYHTESDERIRDVGMSFEKADVLLSEDFRYFGKDGTDDYKRDPIIEAAIVRLGRSFRVNHGEDLPVHLMELKTKSWQIPQKKQVKPTSLDHTKLCNTGQICDLSSGLLR